MALRSRCFGHCFLEGINNIIDLRKEIIIGMRFGGLLQLKCNRLHIKLCIWLINKVNVAIRCIDLSEGQQVGLSCHEVDIVMGIPHRGHGFLLRD